MTTTLCLLERVMGYQYVCRLQNVCKTSEKKRSTSQRMAMSSAK